MKKLLEIVICAAIALGIAAGCSKTDPGPGPEPTQVPAGTAVPMPTEVPTEVPTPTPIEPCVRTGAGNAWKGDCVASDTCRDGNDGFFYGKDCKTKEAM